MSAQLRDCPHKQTSNQPCVITDGPGAYVTTFGHSPVCKGCGSAPFQTGVALAGDEAHGDVGSAGFVKPCCTCDDRQLEIAGCICGYAR
jgi:hypothetical protein